MTDSKTSFGAIANVVGIQMYSFLRPKDLQSLSHTTRNFATEVREKLVRICMEVMPLKSVDPLNPRRSLTFSKGHSSRSREEFVNYIVGKAHDEGLRLDETSTIEESLMGLREKLIRDTYVFVHRPGDQSGEIHVINMAYDEVVPNQFLVGRIPTFDVGRHTKDWICSILSLEGIIAGKTSLSIAGPGICYQSIMISTPNEGEEMEIQWDDHIIWSS